MPTPTGGQTASTLPVNLERVAGQRGGEVGAGEPEHGQPVEEDAVDLRQPPGRPIDDAAGVERLAQRRTRPARVRLGRAPPHSEVTGLPAVEDETLPQTAVEPTSWGPSCCMSGHILHQETDRDASGRWPGCDDSVSASLIRV